jgi:hypothetical protein
VFKFEEVPGRVLEEKGVMLNAGSRKSDSRVLIKRQSLRFGAVRQGLPRFLRQEHQTEMTGIDALLFARHVLYHMSDQLMVAQSERHGVARFAPECAAEPFDIEALGRIDVVDWKSQMKQDARTQDDFLCVYLIVSNDLEQ